MSDIINHAWLQRILNPRLPIKTLQESPQTESPQTRAARLENSWMSNKTCVLGLTQKVAHPRTAVT